MTKLLPLRRAMLSAKWDLVALGVVLAILVLPNLETYPATWFDEGVHLQVPKNLAIYGKYAVRSSDGFRMFDPGVTVGPTVLLPIALAFKLFGVGLLQARVVMVIFLGLLVCAFYLVASRLYGRTVAIVASLLFVVTPHSEVSPTVLSRQVLGEGPALLFFLLGALLWFKSLEVARGWYLAGCGLFLGLAMLTKAQYLIVIPPAIALMWLLSNLLRLRIGWQSFVVPVVVALSCVVVWYAWQLMIVGLPQFLEYMSSFTSGVAGTLTFLPATRVPENARSLFAPHLFKLQALAFAYVVFVDARRRQWNAERLFLFSFTAAWICWWLFSIGWLRYAFPIFALGNVFLAKLVYDLSDCFDVAPLTRIVDLRGKSALVPVKNLAVTLLAAAIILVSLAHAARGVLLRRDDTPQRLARYVNSFVEPDKVIESFEWEIAFLTHHNYHHPPLNLVQELSAHVFLGTPYSPSTYDFSRYSPEYVLVGEFAKWTGLYPDDFLRDECRLVTSIGAYDLYEVNE